MTRSSFSRLERHRVPVSEFFSMNACEHLVPEMSLSSWHSQDSRGRSSDGFAWKRYTQVCWWSMPIEALGTSPATYGQAALGQGDYRQLGLPELFLPGR